MTAETVLSLAHYLLPIYQQQPIVIDHGQGARVWDKQGREYIDLAAGIAVAGLGYGDPDLLAALHHQADKLWHTSNVFFNEPALHLAQELVDASTFAERVFFCNSGTEANEAAIKLVRRWAATQQRPPQDRVIITFEGSFHGRTLAATAATGQRKYHEGFEPLPTCFCQVPFNDGRALAQAMVGQSVAAVLVEPIQGEGGVVPADPGYLAQVRALCDRHHALLVFDEIQCGMSRTGTLFAYWQDGVVPDVVTLAKGLGCGFPIGAMLVGPKAALAMSVGMHGTTFGGNPLAAAVARVALQKLRSAALIANVHRQSANLQQHLTAINQRCGGVFAQVRGRGLLLGAVLLPQYRGAASAIVQAAAKRGVLLLQAGPDVVRFAPPLTLSDAECEMAMQRLQCALTDWLSSGADQASQLSRQN